MKIQECVWTAALWFTKKRALAVCQTILMICGLVIGLDTYFSKPPAYEELECLEGAFLWKQDLVRRRGGFSFCTIAVEGAPEICVDFGVNRRWSESFSGRVRQGDRLKIRAEKGENSYMAYEIRCEDEALLSYKDASLDAWTRWKTAMGLATGIMLFVPTVYGADIAAKRVRFKRKRVR